MKIQKPKEKIDVTNNAENLGANKKVFTNNFRYVILLT